MNAKPTLARPHVVTTIVAAALSIRYRDRTAHCRHRPVPARRRSV